MFLNKDLPRRRRSAALAPPVFWLLASFVSFCTSCPPRPGEKLPGGGRAVGHSYSPSPVAYDAAPFPYVVSIRPMWPGGGKRPAFAFVSVRGRRTTAHSPADDHLTEVLPAEKRAARCRGLRYMALHSRRATVCPFCSLLVYTKSHSSEIFIPLIRTGCISHLEGANAPFKCFR